MTTNTATDVLLHKGSGLQVVVGLGQSGLSVARYLANQGYQVAVTDAQVTPSLARSTTRRRLVFANLVHRRRAITASGTYCYKPWHLSCYRSCRRCPASEYSRR